MTRNSEFMSALVTCYFGIERPRFGDAYRTTVHAFRLSGKNTTISKKTARKRINAAFIMARQIELRTQNLGMFSNQQGSFAALEYASACLKMAMPAFLKNMATLKEILPR